jgi:hypothetical protein
VLNKGLYSLTELLVLRLNNKATLLGGKMKTPNSLPFGLIHRDTTTCLDRGYGIYPEKWNYDPKTQVSDLIKMGSTEPTTYSRVSSTGFFNDDRDEGADDTGND